MIFPLLSGLTDRWLKFTIKKVGTGADSYFTVNGGAAIPAENDQSQDIALGSLPSYAVIEAARAKTQVVFSGATTAVLDGIFSAAGEEVDFNNYDLKAAVADTNIVKETTIGLHSVAAKALVARLTVTVETMRDIADGCTLDIWLDVSRLIGD